MNSPTKGLTDPIQFEYERFHKANGWIFSEVVRIARQHKSDGLVRGSMDAIFHEIRTSSRMRTGVPVRLNNDLTRCYAREAMKADPFLAGFFELRPTKQDKGLRSVAQIMDESAGLGGLFGGAS